jgi:ABC-2 type transport system permease protein
MNVLRFEWVKLRSVRSTWLLLLGTIVSGTALGVVGVSDLSISQGPILADWDPTAASLKGTLFAQLVIGMLGALSITTEYDSGLLGTSLSVVPSRLRLLAAKATVVAIVGAVTGAATTVASFYMVQFVLDTAGVPSAAAGEPGVLYALVGASFYLMLIALLGLAVGVLTRSTAGSLAVLIGVTLLIPAIGPGLPGSIGEWFAHYWPTTTGRLHGPTGSLGSTVLGMSMSSYVVLRLRDI